MNDCTRLCNLHARTHARTQAADFHSLHMPLTAGTKNLFGDSAFAKIKKGSRIINVARGGVIDEAALLKALEAKQVVCAALDVFMDEPPKFEGEPATASQPRDVFNGAGVHGRLWLLRACVRACVCGGGQHPPPPLSATPLTCPPARPPARAPSAGQATR